MKTPQRRVWIEANGERWEHVCVTKLSGHEALGQLFSFDLQAIVGPDHEIPEDARPGVEVSLVFELHGEEVRRVHGALDVVRKHCGGANDRRTVDLGVVPRVARLRLVETQEIFLGRSVPEILRSKLERHGFGDEDFDLRLLGTYAAREFVMQHRESDLTFVSRIAEHVGISFFFEHHEGRDRIVFTDHEAGFRRAPDHAIAFQSRGEGDAILSLARVERPAPTSHIVHDYNYRAPLVDITAVVNLASGSGGGVVEYGSSAKTPAEAEALALARAEERRSQKLVYEGESVVVGFTSGARVTVTDVPGDVATGWLLVEVTHEAVMPFFDEQASVEPGYRNTFRAVPGGFTYRPPRVTPRPTIGGVITGVIQPGPGGETDGAAPVDAEGRYTVSLHLDTADLGAQKASHPIRMAQPFTGAGYGMHFPLRRGTEVIVAFANGDPDRPIIVGALYNATSPNPVVASNAQSHQIRTSTGGLLEFSQRR